MEIHLIKLVYTVENEYKIYIVDTNLISHLLAQDRAQIARKI